MDRHDSVGAGTRTPHIVALLEEKSAGIHARLSGSAFSQPEQYYRGAAVDGSLPATVELRGWIGRGSSP